MTQHMAKLLWLWVMWNFKLDKIALTNFMSHILWSAFLKGWEQTGGVFGYSLYLLIASMGVFILGIVLVFLSGKQIKKRLKQKFCPTSPEVEEVVITGSK